MSGEDIVTPIMPTGSGLVDLEIAREPDTLAGGEVIPPERAPTDGAAGVPQAEARRTRAEEGMTPDPIEPEVPAAITDEPYSEAMAPSVDSDAVKRLAHAVDAAAPCAAAPDQGRAGLSAVEAETHGRADDARLGVGLGRSAGEKAPT